MQKKREVHLHVQIRVMFKIVVIYVLKSFHFFSELRLELI